MSGGTLASKKKKTARSWTKTTRCAKYAELRSNTTATQQTSGAIWRGITRSVNYPKKKLLQQPSLEKAFGTKFPSTSTRAENITSALANFICKDLRPYSVVENVGFRHLLQTLEPRYAIPTRKQLSEVTIPKMYTDVKNNVATALKSAERVAITCDSWTSRATDSYLTITSHYIDSKWCLVSHVLQTRAIEASHTASHLAELLTEALREWALIDKDPCVVTDNAANMVRAVATMRLLHVGCYAHTLNLASQAALKIPAVARLLGRVRRITAFFHRSTKASHMMKEKQKILNLPQHKLVMDVVTRWNSALDMLERFLEQQPAITATLLSPEVRRNEQDLCTLTEADVTVAEDIVKALKPLKAATLVMSEEMTPTISVIAPLHAQLLDHMTSVPDDSPVIKELKTAMHVNLGSRYEALKETLYEASALDPRFKALPFLSEVACDDTFTRLTTILTEAACLEQVEASNPQADGAAFSAQQEDNSHAADGADPPPTKRSKEPSSALMSLLGPAYKPKEPAAPTRSAPQKAQDEIKGYREADRLPLSENPLSWWMKHEASYPLLARQAKRYLCVPGTSVPSERVFSTAGDIVTAKRSCLTPGHVDQLLFLQKNLTVPGK